MKAFNNSGSYLTNFEKSALLNKKAKQFKQIFAYFFVKFIELSSRILKVSPVTSIFYLQYALSRQQNYKIDNSVALTRSAGGTSLTVGLALDFFFEFPRYSCESNKKMKI